MFKSFRNKPRLCETILYSFLRHNSSGSFDLNQAYNPKEVEKDGNSSGYFEPSIKFSKPFSLVLPPPNITGALHLGHALTVTIEDVLIRWHRMRGFETLWVPGMDHAGIATQVVVEKLLWKKQKLTRHNLGRELFQKEILKWKEDKSEIIRQQLRLLGASLSWHLEVFTMDSKQSKAVTEAFIKLFDSGLIYRSDYLVNWSCVLQSAISDVEVDHVQIDGPTYLPVPGYEKPIQFGVLTKFAYKLLESEDEIVVSTTRPETILGDVAVAVNPKDDRYSSFIGRKLWHPFRKEAIPIIADDFVDSTFGSGAVKITPAHDPIDFEVGKRHNLHHLQIIDEKGVLNDICGEYSGLLRFEARKAILQELGRLDLLRGREDHVMSVPMCSRSKDIIEFLIKPQWFIKCEEMARRAIDDVKSGRLVIEPRHFEKNWFNWLENIRDWCVSRQLWWGHRISVYLCSLREGPDRKSWIAAESTEMARTKAAALFSTALNNVIVEQDEDVLDTWFSSALFPFSTLGWPQQKFDEFYPLSLMETGHDILFFWVSRMVMLGTQLTGKLPFHKILLHGVVCDAGGRKMSKSLGNVISPENVIQGSSLEELEESSQRSYKTGVLSKEELKKALQGQKRMFPAGIPACGADALRFTLCSHNIKSHFINFDVEECNTNRLFCNKIWQATKFVKLWSAKIHEAQTDWDERNVKLSKMDKWILSRLTGMVEYVNEGLDKHDFHLVTMALKNFLYYDFCDVYLESTKRGLKTIKTEEAKGHCATLLKCLDVGLRALSPFMPYLSQHLHQRLFLNYTKEIDYPQDLNWRDEKLEEEIQNLLDVVVGIRRLKKLFNVTGKHKARVCVVSKELVLHELESVIEDLSGCEKASLKAEEESGEETVTDTIGSHSIIHLKLPPEVKKTLQIDPEKLEKKRNKLLAELEKIQSMTSCESYRLKAASKVQKAHAKKMENLEEELTRINYMQKFCSS